MSLTFSFLSNIVALGDVVRLATDGTVDFVQRVEWLKSCVKA